MAERIGERKPAQHRTDVDGTMMRDGGAEQDRLAQSFAAALRAVELAPQNEDAWNHAEDLAEDLERPDDVANTYRNLLEHDLKGDHWSFVAKRAADFFDAWYGDDPDAMSGLLLRIIERDPQAKWAFERATLVLTIAERWDELLRLYDRFLGATREPAERRRLLDDAAHVAKDFAHRPDRAIDYMQMQLALDPGNAALAAASERLLEREQRWTDLVELWQKRVPELDAPAARKTRLRIATALLDHLGAPDPALAELTRLVDEVPGHPEACAQLERVLTWTDASPSLRTAALDLLRNNYEAAHRSADVVHAIEKFLPLAAPVERLPLMREVAARLANVGEDQASLTHYAALLALDPTDGGARAEMRELARRSNLHESFVSALVHAVAAANPAQAAVLQLEAGHVCRTILGATDRAIALYTKVVELADADPTLSLTAAHHLEELLRAAHRDRERLDVLERLAQLETATEVRRGILGETGRLADRLGDPDRALAAYARRLQSDPEDLAALDASIQVLRNHGRYPALALSLGQRAETTATTAQQRRADLVAIARLQADALGTPNAAIESWFRIRSEFGDDAESTDALDGLLTQAKRWAELAEILDRAGTSGRLRSAELLVRQGAIHQHQLADPTRATTCYAQALALEPSHEAARLGLKSLARLEICATQATTALAAAYRGGHEWQALLDLTDVAVAAARSIRDAVAVLREAADLHEQRASNLRAAQRSIARAFVLDPSDLALEDDLRRLAEAAEGWEEAVQAFDDAARACSSPARLASLRRTEGMLREMKLGDAEGAVAAYREAARHEPNDVQTQRAIVRASALCGSWTAAAEAFAWLCRALGGLDEDALAGLTAAARHRSDWTPLLRALAGAISLAMPRPVARDLEAAVARWQRDERGDLALAEAAAIRAVNCDPTHPGSLLLLTEIQRQQPEHREGPRPRLAETLVQLDIVSERSLDALVEAAEIATIASADPVWLRSLLDALYRKSARLLALSVHDEPDAILGTSRPETVLIWAVERLVELDRRCGQPERAIAVLTSAAEFLPLPDDRVVALRLQAARLCTEAGQIDRAIEQYRRVLQRRPEDLALIREVASLCDEDRVPELVNLRNRELVLVRDPERRLELRLEISRLGGTIERMGGRIESLKANLEDMPGHRPSIEALGELMRERGQLTTLADVLTEQATRLEDHAAARAAELWSEIARLSEHDFDDPKRAIAALERGVALAPNADALDALARLHLQREDPTAAAEVLTRRLQMTEPDKRVPVLLRLAKARIAAGSPSEAITALEAAFRESPKSAEARKLLVRLYRDEQQWEALAETMSTASEHITETATLVAYAKEAATIFDDRLGQPERGVSILERAHALAPDDREVKSRLVEGLRMAGRLAEARTLVQDLIESHGRRRSPQRATAHLQLARVAHAEGEVKEALDQLERASNMDPSSHRILRTLAEMALETDQLERSERAYRALLIQVKRKPRNEQDGPPQERIGATEVLYELSRIARHRGETVQASELVESVMESLASEDDTVALQALARRYQDHGLVHRVLRVRLERTALPTQRAELLGELALLQEDALDQPEAALSSRLGAIEIDPGTPVHHERARVLATRLGLLGAYVRCVEALLVKARRTTDVYARFELLLRLAEAIGGEGGDHDRCAELLGEAESLGVREVDVVRTGARIAAARGDRDAEQAYLERLSALGGGQAETRADAMYRLAEVQLASKDMQATGIETITAALEADFSPERAIRILRRATESATSDALLSLFERVARRANDDAVLLLAIERRIKRPTATPEEVREGVGLALARGETERAETLMLRAVELATAQPERTSNVDWALSALAQLRQESGDFAGAAKWLREAIDSAPAVDGLLSQAQALAQAVSGERGDLTLAVKIYEGLRQRKQGSRAIWEPLVELYRKLGELGPLTGLVDEAIGEIEDRTERNALRLDLVRTLYEHPSRDSDTTRLLTEILSDEPDHRDARDLLGRLLERSGQGRELGAWLQRELDEARSRRDGEAVAVVALRLYEHLSSTEPAAALATLKDALELAPEHVGLIEAALSMTRGEAQVDGRRDLLRRLIEVSPPERAAAHAGELAALETEQDNPAAALRALQLAHRHQPDHRGFRQRLEAAYLVQRDHRGLANHLLQTASRTQETTERVAILRRTATILRDDLGDASAAADTFERASSSAPDDAGLALELAEVLMRAGQRGRASTLLSAWIDDPPDDPALQLGIRKLRAGLRATERDLPGHVEDLEAAYAIDPQGIASDLIDALDRQRGFAAQHGDIDLERQTTLRVVELFVAQGERERARTALSTWVDRERKDLDALRRLKQLEGEDGRWAALAKVCARLVAVDSGQSQIDAALELARACRELGTLGEARAGLEHARRKHPDNDAIRRELIAIYEATGSDRELSRLLSRDVETVSDPAERLEVLRRIAELHTRHGETELAVSALEEIARLDPDNLAVSLDLTTALVETRELDRAEEIVDNALLTHGARRGPEPAQLFYRKAQIAAARGDGQAQLLALQQAFNLDRNNGVVAAQLADLAEALEVWEVAIRVLRTITLSDAPCPISRAHAFLRQARICDRRGDHQRAVLWARKAKHEAPQDPEIDAFLLTLGDG